MTLLKEYSAFEAKNIKGLALKDLVNREIMVCGIASEYCCRETALDFNKAGKEVAFLSDKVAYVDKDDHEKNLADLKDKIVVVYTDVKHECLESVLEQITQTRL